MPQVLRELLRARVIGYTSVILLENRFSITHWISRISETIKRLKKNANSPTKIMVKMPMDKTMERATKLRIMVPKIPANKQGRSFSKHFKSTKHLLQPNNKTAIRTKTSPNTPKPKTIQVAVVIPGISPKANRIATRIPTTKLTGNAMLRQGEKPQ
jgi:hypothetical protein